MNKHNIDNQAVTYHFNFIFNGDEYISPNKVNVFVSMQVFIIQKRINFVFLALIFYSKACCDTKKDMIKETNIISNQISNNSKSWTKILKILSLMLLNINIFSCYKTYIIPCLQRLENINICFNLKKIFLQPIKIYFP